MKLHAPLAFALVLALGLETDVRAADQSFEDTTCPNVTQAGRHLNDLVDTSKVLTDDLVAAAAAMVGGYRECVAGYDRDQYNNTNGTAGQVTNLTPVGRLYARLALARSLERIGEYAADAKKYGDARAAYTEAIKWIDDMDSIAAGGPSFGDTPQGRLISKGADAKKSAQTALAQLPPS